MKKLKIFMVGILAMAFSACSSINVTTDYDPSVNFKNYKTYSWYTGEIPGDQLANNDLTKNRITASVDQILKEKGFELTDENEADFIVVTHVGIKERTEIHTTGYGWYRPYYGPHYRDVYVSNYEEGTLVIDVLDKKREEIIWRGTGSKIIREYSSPEERTEAIHKAVSKILGEFFPM